MDVDRCICTNRTFADLKAMADTRGYDLRALSAATGCGARCGYCIAYLRRTLATGQLVFHEMLEKETL